MYISMYYFIKDLLDAETFMTFQGMLYTQSSWSFRSMKAFLISLLLKKWKELRANILDKEEYVVTTKEKL